jgi:hypothetical protein
MKTLEGVNKSMWNRTSSKFSFLGSSPLTSYIRSHQIRALHLANPHIIRAKGHTHQSRRATGHSGMRACCSEASCALLSVEQQMCAPSDTSYCDVYALPSARRHRQDSTESNSHHHLGLAYPNSVVRTLDSLEWPPHLRNCFYVPPKTLRLHGR